VVVKINLEDIGKKRGVNRKPEKTKWVFKWSTFYDEK